MNGTRHHEVGEYLRRLQRSMADLPSERRDEILLEIEEHISELLAENPEATDVDVRNILERVGDPEDIAAEARDRLEVAPTITFRPRRFAWTDITAIALLVVGDLMIAPLHRYEGAFVAWLAAIVLVWFSEVWTTRDKLAVTLVLPAGAVCAVALNGAGDEGVLYFAVILFAGIWPPTHLGVKLRGAGRTRADEAVEGAQASANAPSAPRPRDRAATWIIVGVIVLAVVVSTLNAFISSGSEDHDPPSTTEARFDRLRLGDSREEVATILGDIGDAGSIVAGLDPNALEEPDGIGDRQFDDCWTYAIIDGSPGSEASVCFDPSGAVEYTRLRIDHP